MFWIAIAAFALPLVFYLYQHNSLTRRQQLRLEAIRKRLDEKEQAANASTAGTVNDGASLDTAPQNEVFDKDTSVNKE
ncbi:hypothetical protein SAMN02745866_01009 [Alteromonadaceae bacterium Bs31]|nr:hypothetical protein SAMN02745866_01009 [Alteromonadaceae bacterium Bs31]